MNLVTRVLQTNICFVSDKRYCFTTDMEIWQITAYSYLLTGLWYGVKPFCLKIRPYHINSPNSKIDKNIQRDLPRTHDNLKMDFTRLKDTGDIIWEKETQCLLTHCFDGRQDYYALGQWLKFESCLLSTPGIFESDRIYMRSRSEGHIHLFTYLFVPPLIPHMKTISCASGFKMEWTH